MENLSKKEQLELIHLKKILDQYRLNFEIILLMQCIINRMDELDQRTSDKPKIKNMLKYFEGSIKNYMKLLVLKDDSLNANAKRVEKFSEVTNTIDKFITDNISKDYYNNLLINYLKRNKDERKIN